MSNKNKLTYNKVEEIIKAKLLLDLHDDFEEENSAKIVECINDEDRIDEPVIISNIQKSNVKLLCDVDVKYKGVISSRKDFEKSSEETGFSKYNLFLNDIENTSIESTEQIEYEQVESNEGKKLHMIVSKSTTEDNNQIDSIIPQDQDELKKGFSVQNQLCLWEKLLEIRIYLQKILIGANNLPVPAEFKKLMENNLKLTNLKIETIQNVENLLLQFCEMQKLLIHQYPDTKHFSYKLETKSNFHMDNANNYLHSKYLKALKTNYLNYKDYRNTVLTKWCDRMKMSIPQKKRDTTSNILKKIETALTNKDELIKKSQICKKQDSSYKCEQTTNNISILTENEKMNNAQGVNIEKDSVGTSIYSPEIYNDTEFYLTQLRELIEYKTQVSNNSNNMVNQLLKLQTLRKKMKKSVDTRVSKGRKIRYIIHNKLINFMAPNCDILWANDSKRELFKSLFENTKQN